MKYLLVAAALFLGACTSSMTAPQVPVQDARPSFDIGGCRSGYNIASGRCNDDSSSVSAQAVSGCRSGYNIATGRCNDGSEPFASAKKPGQRKSGVVSLDVPGCQSGYVIAYDENGNPIGCVPQQ